MCQRAFAYRRADLFHPSLEEAEVVDGDEGGTEHFFYVEEVAEVAAGEVLAAVTVAALFEGAFVEGVFGVAEAAGAGEGKGEAVAAVASGQDAVEHVDAALDGFKDVLGVADAHEVAGFFLGEERRGVSDGFDHAGVTFADGEAAEGVAGEIECGEEACGGGAGVEVGASLDDAEEGRGRSWK